MGRKIEISDEIVQEIAGSLPFNKDATCKYVPSMYKKHKYIYDKQTKEFFDTGSLVVTEEFHPVFLLRRMDENEYQVAEMLLQEIVEKSDQESAKRRQEEIAEIVRHCVVGWYNFIDIGKKEEIDYIKDAEGFTDMKVWNVYGNSNNKTTIINQECINDLFVKICKISCLQQPDIFSLK